VSAKEEFLAKRKRELEEFWAAEKRFSSINIGDKVYYISFQMFGKGLFLGIVKEVDIDNRCVLVMDYSYTPPKEDKWSSFLTEEEFLKLTNK